MSIGQKSSTHPKNPPTSEDEEFFWLRLLRSRRVGPTTFHRLIAEYDTAENALVALPEIAAEAGVRDYAPCPEADIEAELKAARRAKARLLCYGAKDYPQELYDLPDAPPLLWARGQLELLAKDKIALVGARNASSLGLRMARSLAAEINKEGFAIVSGMARGIDAAAHSASLEGGTIAVFGGGVDRIYPAENTDLAKAILAKGLILSEQAMGLQPQARHFPARNRIISGLAKAVVVVEAAAKSGSLITAKNALDQGREVLAVPGHPFDARAAGCNILIRDGARLVRKATDILDEMPKPAPASAAMAFEAPPRQKALNLQETSALHSKILNRLGPIPLAEDQLITDMKSSAQKLAPALAQMELHGKILRRAGGLLSRRSS